LNQISQIKKISNRYNKRRALWALLTLGEDMPSSRAFLRKIEELGLDPQISYVPGPNGIPVPKNNHKQISLTNNQVSTVIVTEKPEDKKDSVDTVQIESISQPEEILEQDLKQENEIQPELTQEEVQLQPKKKNNLFKKKTTNQE